MKYDRAIQIVAERAKAKYGIGGGDVTHVQVQHDDWCPVLKNPPSACGCDPLVMYRDIRMLASEAERSRSIEVSTIHDAYVRVEDIDLLDHNEWLETQTCMGAAPSIWDGVFKANEYSVPNAVQTLDELWRTTASPFLSRSEFVFRGLFSAQWAHSAFPRLETSHTYAAALMCTELHIETLSDLKLQWQAFEVSVPDGLLIVDGLYDARSSERMGGSFECSAIRVLITSVGSSIVLIDKTRQFFLRDTHIIAAESSLTPDGELSKLLTQTTTKNSSESRADVSAVARMWLLAKRLIGGLLLAIQHTSNFKERRCGGSTKKHRERGEPEHRVIFVGAPIKVDVRPAVKEFLAGERRGKNAPSSFQVLVRGHYQRVVVGVGRAGRKVKWYEPYWRGPKDAPILSRPKKVGP